jgi:hypothetical protein
MMRPDAKVKKVYLCPKPVDFRKSINGLAALVALDIKVEVFSPVLFVFLNRTRSQVKILYWERNGSCLWFKRLEAERFKTKPDVGEEAIELTVEELNWLSTVSTCGVTDRIRWAASNCRPYRDRMIDHEEQICQYGIFRAMKRHGWYLAMSS